MKRYKYILFDADNTLFDFSQAERVAFKNTCEKNGLIYSEEIQVLYSKINDSLWKRLETGEINLEFLKVERFRQLLECYNKDYGLVDVAPEKMRDDYISILGEQTCLINGAEEICKYLSSEYKMFIVTNGISKIQRSRIGKSALKDFFADVFVSEEIGYAKPSKQYFDHVISKIGDYDKSNYLVVGDSLTSDCDGAINYGLDICYYNPNGKSNNGRELTYTVNELSELKNIL